MQDVPDIDPIDETFEARAALKLTLRGLALAFVAGLLWYLPTGHWLIGLVPRTLAAFAVIWAVVPLAPAGLVYRNIVGRWIGLWGWKKALFALGITIFALLLALAALAFRLAGAVYG